MIGLKVGLKGVHISSTEQKEMKEEQHTMSYPRALPASGYADGSNLCFMKVPLPKMGRPGDKKTSHFVFIHLNDNLNSPLLREQMMQR